MWHIQGFPPLACCSLLLWCKKNIIKLLSSRNKKGPHSYINILRLSLTHQSHASSRGFSRIQGKVISRQGICKQSFFSVKNVKTSFADAIYNFGERSTIPLPPLMGQDEVVIGLHMFFCSVFISIFSFCKLNLIYVWICTKMSYYITCITNPRNTSKNPQRVPTELEIETPDNYPIFLVQVQV